jgi:hypothetical protein
MPILATVADAPTMQFISRGCETLTVQCNPGNYNGGAEITAYQVTYYEYFDNINNNAAFGINNNVLRNSVMIQASNDGLNNNAFALRQATITGLTDGRTYAFQCSALNRIGYSTPSAVLQIQSGTVPFQPQNVLTDLIGDDTNVAITWENQYQCPSYWPVTGCTVAIQYDRFQVVNGFSQRVVSYADATPYCAETPALNNINANNNIQRYVPPSVCTVPTSVLTGDVF